MIDIHVFYGEKVHLSFSTNDHWCLSFATRWFFSYKCHLQLKFCCNDQSQMTILLITIEILNGRSFFIHGK